MYFLFGFALGLVFFTGPSLQTFPDVWFIVVLILSVLCGGVTHLIFRER